MIHWTATYSDGSVTQSHTPDAYRRIQRDRPYVFSLYADHQALGTWSVATPTRLLYAHRHKVDRGAATDWVIVGTEERTGASAQVWLFRCVAGKWTKQQRDGWPKQGSPDYLDWHRPSEV